MGRDLGYDVWVAVNDRPRSHNGVSLQSLTLPELPSLDLASSLGDRMYDFFLIALDSREKEIVAQLQRPAFKSLQSVAFRYLLFSDVSCNCGMMGRFGDDWRVF